MDQKAYEYRMRLSFAWNFRKDKEWVTGLSAQGLHLDKPGLFRYRFVRKESQRYVYRLDYQSLSGKALKDYLALYEDAGWELVGMVVGWRYFRKPYAPGETYELYTDSTSLKQFYARIQTVFLVIGMANFTIAGTNAINWYNNMRESSYSSLGGVVWLNFVIAALMGTGWYQLEKRKKRET
jgi:hypothetical protein